MTMSEVARNKTILTILLLGAIAAAVAISVFSTGVFQAVLYSVFAVSGVILTTFLIVALN